MNDAMLGSQAEWCIVGTKQIVSGEMSAGYNA